jgi:hypothetical protein
MRKGKHDAVVFRQCAGSEQGFRLYKLYRCSPKIKCHTHGGYIKMVFKKVSSKILFILRLLQRPAQVQVCYKTGERAPLLWARARVLCSTREPRTTARATKKAISGVRKSLSRLESQQLCIFYLALNLLLI